MDLDLALIEEQREVSPLNRTMPAVLVGALRFQGFIGGAIRAFSGSPSVSVVGKVKNKQLQGQLNSALGDFEGLKQTGQESLSDYLGKYFSDQPSRNAFTNQEVGAASNFYNGNVANTLASLRQSRAAAVDSAADVGVQQAIRAVNSNALEGDGGPSSYQDREMMSAVAPIRAQAAVDNANQARQDYGFVTQGQMDEAGKREQMLTTNDQSSLVPYEAKAGMFGQNMGYLGNLLQADQLNHFYGLKQQTNPWADFFDSADQGIMNATSIASSVMKMKHGGLVRVSGYKDGGTVKGGRKDYAAGGGGVSGPGGPREDRVPAWLSDGEYVMPAAAVKMPGVLPLLEKIRQMALKDSTASRKPMRFGHYDMGGPVDGGGFGGMDPSLASNSGVSDWSNVSGNPDPTSWPGQQKLPQAQPQQGGGGGGLQAQAMALQARADRDKMTQFFPSSSTFGTEPGQRFVPPSAGGAEEENMPFFANQAQGVINV